MYKNTHRILVAAAAAFALAAGAAHAQTPPSAPAGGAMHGPMGGMGHMGHGMMHGHRFGPGGHFGFPLKGLHDKLHLSADQEKQWQAAIATAKQNREAARANHEAFRKQIEALRQQPVLDLNAMHDAHQHLAQQDEQLREQTATTWLAVYNSLNAQQKTTVSDTLKAGFAKMEKRREKMREHWQHRHQGAAAASAPAAQ